LSKIHPDPLIKIGHSMETEWADTYCSMNEAYPTEMVHHIYSVIWRFQSKLRILCFIFILLFYILLFYILLFYIFIFDSYKVWVDCTREEIWYERVF